MKKQWLYDVGIEFKGDCGAYAYTYRDNKVIGADFNDSDNTCTLLFDDEDAFIAYLDYVDDMTDYDDMQFRWRCLNCKKY